MVIKVLVQEVASKIAAGEVVERPFSVIKELVENSLDAGATRVTVEVRGGGIDLMRVVDNGCGMPPNEVELAFRRYATSKLSSAEDLETVATLGFRGEALPCIAAVARVRMVTRLGDSDQGWEVSIPWGKVEESVPQGAPPGTSVTVRELFDNVPARLKFLRSPSAEAGRISDLMGRFALASPQVAFHLTVEGRDVLKTPGTGSLEEALVAVYGTRVFKEMLLVEREDASNGYQVQGYTSAPSMHRSNRSHITFFVNGRWVQSRPLSVALEEAYRGLLPGGRHPLSVLSITLPYDEVDVNVHPAKREVRFRREGLAFSAVQRAVRGALMASSPVPQVHLEPRALEPSFQTPLLSVSSPLVEGKPEGSDGGEPAHRSREITPLLRVLGQASNSYVVADGPDGIFLIDQHAAHERVLYEKVFGEMVRGEPSVQALLEPATVELSPRSLEMVETAQEELEGYGFRLEPFGEGGIYILRAVPLVFRDSDPAQGLQEVLDLALGEGRLKDRKEVLAASIACHSAIRAGMALADEEMREMVALLERAENPHTCPHGRPTMVHLSSQHLERQFGRR